MNDTPLGDWVHVDVAERLERLLNSNAIARCDAQDLADKLTEQKTALVEALETSLSAMLEASGRNMAAAREVSAAICQARAVLASLK